MLNARKKKPIALITDKTERAVTWALNNLKVEKYDTGRREIRASGRTFIICTQPEHLLALEISDYKDVGGSEKPASWFIRMHEMAQTRIR